MIKRKHEKTIIETKGKEENVWKENALYELVDLLNFIESPFLNIIVYITLYVEGLLLIILLQVY